ncbi:hypothetical protein J6590_037604, partial [Homalodisca vitripennis]
FALILCHLLHRLSTPQHSGSHHVYVGLSCPHPPLHNIPKRPITFTLDYRLRGITTVVISWMGDHRVILSMQIAVALFHSHHFHRVRARAREPEARFLTDHSSSSKTVTRTS